MYNLDHIVKMYFGAVSAQMIIRNAVTYNDFPAQEFARLTKVYLPQYSETEDRQLYRYIKDSASEDGHPFAGMENRSGTNVFAALEELSEQLLTMEENEVLCIYGQLLRLRDVTTYVEEDLLVCAYLAVHDKRYKTRHSDFGWDVTIGHNNVQLMRIMQRGISENHFHLFGSAPSFHMIWIYLMNHIDLQALRELGSKIAGQQRVTKEHYSVNYLEDAIDERILKAMLIRVHLVCFLTGREEKTFSDSEIEELLTGKKKIWERVCDIQSMIDRIKEHAALKNMGDITDYAMYFMKDIGGTKNVYRWTAGERWMMYRMLSEELYDSTTENDCKKRFYRWFYAYLVMKQNIRNEFVQTNATLGFENFAIYTSRKNIYGNMAQMVENAIYGSIGKGNIRCLEIRITPENSAFETAVFLNELDHIIEQKRDRFPHFDYYYVFHFTKTQDKPLIERICFDGLHCRHYEKRRQLEQQANEICCFRENDRGKAAQVLGIDACSQEIGCRPEVFATVFRFLANHTVENIPGEKKVCQLKMTYHVGEDFLDAADGLRAMEEAIMFLNLQCGDRIGHGTVLGIDIRKWYALKQNTIVLPQQDYLDNVVWLYYKLVEYRLDGFDNLREELLAEFQTYFAEIYLHMEHGNREPFYFDINQYYEAWKLRGDEPELYLTKRFNPDDVFYGREWAVNRRFPERQGNRKHDEIAYLYYLYHYDWDVRNNGAKSIQKYVSALYVDGVAAVQKAMQRDFASKGIGIEANPSSNLLISTMQDYTEHPIVKLYNKDLTWDMEQLKECPQINISINTDDKGVFHTSLENEYALMACAMEKMKDDKGNSVYNRQMVYQWIDNIREMGNMQSFFGKIIENNCFYVDKTDFIREWWESRDA